MWTIDSVKARFVEAADVERRMTIKGGAPSVGGNGWPTFSYDHEDMAGWDDQAIADNLERWQGRKVTKSPEITRWEEVFFDWTALMPQARRIIVWRWAQCIATGGSFSEWCSKNGVVRMTAYNRLDRVVENLSTQFRNEARLFRAPEGRWALQEDGSQAPSGHTMDRPARKSYGEIHPPTFRSEPSCDTLNNPAAVAAFSQHLADTNDKRRQQREAKLKKSLRGVPDEATASAA